MGFSRISCQGFAALTVAMLALWWRLSSGPIELDVATPWLKAAIEETNRRRTKQSEWNEAHGITPESVKKGIGEALSSVYEADYVTAPTVAGGPDELVGHNLRATIAELEAMDDLANRAADALNSDATWPHDIRS